MPALTTSRAPATLRTERHLAARMAGQRAFNAFDLNDPCGFPRPAVAFALTPVPVQVWRKAVLYPVLDTFLLPAIPFPVSYWSNPLDTPNPVRGLTVRNRPVTDRSAQALVPYWVGVNDAAVHRALEAALAQPYDDPDRRLWAALAGLSVEQILALPARTTLDALKAMAGLAADPVVTMHTDSVTA